MRTVTSLATVRAHPMTVSQSPLGPLITVKEWSPSISTWLTNSPASISATHACALCPAIMGMASVAEAIPGLSFAVF